MWPPAAREDALLTTLQKGERKIFANKRTAVWKCAFLKLNYEFIFNKRVERSQFEQIPAREKYNQTLFRINHATTFLTTNYWPNREFNKSLIEHSLEFTGICAMQFWSVVHEVLAQQSSPSDIFLKRWSMSQNILRTTELNYLLI